MIVGKQNDTRKETFFPERGVPATDRDQESTQPASAPPALRRRRRLERTVIVLSIVILIATSALVALFTYWISR